MSPLRRSAFGAATAGLLGAVALAGLGCSSSRTQGAADTDAATTARQAEVARRGATVMPFDLERTTHVFDPQPAGGVQTVVADDDADSVQVRLVREHLREEARRFAAGDFEDPEAVHGAEMPGLGKLREGRGRITVRYSDVAAGGRIVYTTGDPDLVQALHDWFSAQTSDHGAHAAHPPGS